MEVPKPLEGRCLFLFSAFRHAKRTVPEGRGERYKCQLKREVSEAAPLYTLENSNRDGSPRSSSVCERCTP